MFQQVAAQGRVLAGDLWRLHPALQVQAADQDIEDSGHGSQLYAIKHGGQLRTQRVSIFQARHGGLAPPPPSQVKGSHGGVEAGL